MLLSTQTHYFFEHFGYEKALEMFADAGFDALDVTLFKDLDTDPAFCDGYRDYAAELLEKAKECGIVFNQSHAPFPSYKAEDADYNTYIMPKIERAIEFSGMLGIKTVCVHPVTFRNEEQKQVDFNLELYSKLAPIAKKC